MVAGKTIISLAIIWLPPSLVPPGEPACEAALAGNAIGKSGGPVLAVCTPRAL